jgi:hypothetical protein
MDPTKSRAFLKAAERCRKKALSASDPHVWIRFAADWESLAQMMSEQAPATGIGGLGRRSTKAHILGRWPAVNGKGQSGPNRDP